MLKMEKKKLLEFSGIFVLLGIIIVSRLLLMFYNETLLGVDAYSYVYKAKQVSMGQSLSYEGGYAFTLILGSLFTFSGDLVLTSKLFTSLLSVLLIITFFLIGKKFLGYKAAFAAAVLASFETQFIVYSTIPYTEIFLSLLIYVGFYAAVDSRKLVRYILFPVALGLATLTRIEAYIFFAPSMILFTHSEVVKRNRINLRTLFPLVFPLVLYITIPLLAYGIFSHQITRYYFTKTRFDPLERVLIFLTPDLLHAALQSTFSVFSDAFINNLFTFSVILGILFAMVKGTKGIGTKWRKKLLTIVTKQNMLPFSLMLFFCLYMLFITMYAPRGIQIINDQVIITEKAIGQRYLIYIKLLLFYPSAYLICKFATFIADALIQMRVVSSNWNLRLRKLKIRIPVRTVSTVLIIAVLIVPSSFLMWRDAFESASAKNDVMETFTLSSKWLYENMKEDEIAIVPISQIFALVRPDLEPRIVDYQKFWDLAGVPMRVNVTDQEILAVWQKTLDFILSSNVKYLVRDWVDQYCKLIFKVAGTQIESIAEKVNEVKFTLPDGYSNSVRIYQIKRKTDIILLGSYYQISSLADSGTTTSLIDTSKNWIPESLIGLKIKIMSGTNEGTIREIINNTLNAITVKVAWPAPPDNTSRYIIVVDDADYTTSWSLSERVGVISKVYDQIEGSANVRATSDSDVETFAIQYNLGVPGFNASKFKYLIIPAKISTIRSADGIYLVDTSGNSRKWNCSFTTTWTMFVLPLDKYDSQDTEFNINATQYVKLQQRDILENDYISVDAFWFDTAFSISRAETTKDWSIITGDIISFVNDTDRKEDTASIKAAVESDVSNHIRIVYEPKIVLDFSRMSTISFWLKVDRPMNVNQFIFSLRDPSLKDRYWLIMIQEVEENTWTQVFLDITRPQGQTAGFDIEKTIQFRFILKTTSPETLLTTWIDDVKAS